jgi:SAM-dependent methyltransferase
LSFRGEFDAVFSNAALHWMQRPAEVLAGVARALRPGGRFIGELGADGNTATVLRALQAAMTQRGLSFSSRNPWYFPTADEYRGKLERAGFIVTALDVFPRPTPLPGSLIGWLETFAPTFVVGFSPVERTAFFDEVAAALRPQLCDANGQWTVDYVRLRFRAERPAA